MKNFLVRHRAAVSLYSTDEAAHAEAQRLANLHNCPVDLFQNYATVAPKPEPKLHDWPLDEMLDLALSHAKASHRWTCIYGVLHHLKDLGVTTLKVPQIDHEPTPDR